MSERCGRPPTKFAGSWGTTLGGAPLLEVTGPDPTVRFPSGGSHAKESSRLGWAMRSHVFLWEGWPCWHGQLRHFGYAQHRAATDGSRGSLDPRIDGAGSRGGRRVYRH